MAMGRTHSGGVYDRGQSVIPPPTLLLLAVFFTFSFAQNPADAVSLTSKPAITTPVLGSTFLLPASKTSSWATSLKTPSPTSNMVHTIGSPVSSSDHTNTVRDRNEYAFNYYFLFLVLFGVALAISLWLVQRKRNQQKELARLSGQHALARDLDGWVDNRRWMHGRWRSGQPTLAERREEGLNEQGEAPPPYDPKGDATMTDLPTESTQAPVGPAIPLRTLPRTGDENMHPPAYQPELRTAILDSTNPADNVRVISGTGLLPSPELAARI